MASSRIGEEMDRDVRVNGLGVSPGFAVGRVLRLDDRDLGVGLPAEFETRDPRAEIVRLRVAVDVAREQILEIKSRVARELGRGHAYFFEAHLLMLDDQELLKDVERIVRAKSLKAEWAVKVVLDRMLTVYAHVKDDYLRERGSDIEDVAYRLIRALAGEPGADPVRLQRDVIVVAAELPLTAVVEFNLERILGFAADGGGFASHAAIIARSLGIPAVVGLRDLTAQVSPGDTIVVDGTEGFAILNPTKPVMRRYLELRGQQRRVDPNEGAPAEAITLDGHACAVRANVELPSELELVSRYGGAGIGLYRSEFFYLNSLPNLPSEDEQTAFYEQLALATGEDGATIRSFDLGGDKLGFAGYDPERNPALGLRGIRLSLKAEGVFRTHLRAILRASVKGRLRIVLPMISRLSELRAARGLLEACQEELRAEGRPFNSKIPLGVMIEVPSAVFIADHLAAECDFFSIGTNDLIQYLLAVDRSNQQVADTYEPLHPSVLRSLKRVAQVASDTGIPTLVCGEMAANPVHVAVLLGLGFDQLSLVPSLIPLIKKVICAIDLPGARSLADELLSMRSSQEITVHLARELPVRFPGFFGEQAAGGKH
jgi:phosphotransferase system enzyme I (PtsI)